MTIILTIIIFIGIISLVYFLAYNNLQANTIKINEAESIIDELLKKKYDLLLSMQKIISTEVKVDKKIFADLKNLKDKNLSSFKFERKITEFEKLVNKIKNDHSALEEHKDFNKELEVIYTINEKLEATKTFYNKYTEHLNSTVKKFPSNIIAKIHKIKPSETFDGNTNDFKS